MEKSAPSPTVIIEEAPQSGSIVSDKRASRPPMPSWQKKRLIIIGSAVGVVAIAVVIFFIIRSLPSAPNQTDEEGNYVPTVAYSTPADSEDPEGDYLNYLEEEKNKAKTSVEELTAILNQANFEVMTEDYDAALAILDAIDPANYPSHSELFQLYSAYARLYAETAMNQPDLFAEYSQKAEEEKQLLINQQ